MQIYPISYNINPYRKQTPTFQGSVDKLILKIKELPNPYRAEIRFEEAKKVYEYLGFPVVAKKGSHYIVTLPDGFMFPLVKPHGGAKSLHAADVKSLQCAINGDYDKIKRRMLASW